MVLATVASFFYKDDSGQTLHNLPLILAALALGTVAAWVSGKKVAMTDMPQMVALYNGMGGGSAAAIGLVELLKFSAASGSAPRAAVVFAVIGSLIGSISLTGSLIAWAKLDGRMDKRFTFPGQQAFNLLVFIGALVLGVMSMLWLQQPVIDRAGRGIRRLCAGHRGTDHRRHGGRRGRHYADPADGQGDEPFHLQRLVWKLRPAGRGCGNHWSAETH
jgi:hypothetical protein